MANLLCVPLENSGEWENNLWKSHQTEGGPSDPADASYTSLSGSDGGSYSPAGLVGSGQGKVSINAPFFPNVIVWITIAQNQCISTVFDFNFLCFKV